MPEKKFARSLRSYSQLPSEKTALQAQALSTNIRKNERIEEVQFESEPGVRIVGWFVAPQNGAAKYPCVLYISNGYADEAVGEPSPFDAVLRARPRGLLRRVTGDWTFHAATSARRTGLLSANACAGRVGLGKSGAGIPRHWAESLGHCAHSRLPYYATRCRYVATAHRSDRRKLAWRR